MNDHYCKLLEATPARNPAALLGLHNRLFVLLNIRIPAAHSAFILSHHSLGLTLLPSRLILCMSGPTRGRCGVRNLPCRIRLYLRIWYRLFPLLQLVGLFRCRFDFCNVQACALAACTVSVISTNAFAYLPGLLAARPSAFVEGAGFEPTMFKGTLAITIHIIKHRACLRPLGQPSNSQILDSFCG